MQQAKIKPINKIILLWQSQFYLMKYLLLLLLLLPAFAFSQTLVDSIPFDSSNYARYEGVIEQPGLHRMNYTIRVKYGWQRLSRMLKPLCVRKIKKRVPL
jgi:hypothetical protein